MKRKFLASILFVLMILICIIIECVSDEEVVNKFLIFYQHDDETVKPEPELYGLQSIYEEIFALNQISAAIQLKPGKR